MGFIVGRKYHLRATALSSLGLHPNDTLTYVGRKGGGQVKDELLPVRFVFKKADGTPWEWSRTSGELLNGWLEEVTTA